jgi:hypothetical protein
MTMNWKPIVNVNDKERYAAGILGAAMLATAIRPLRPWRLFWAACFFYRALSGNCKGYEILGISTCPRSPKP